MSTKIKVVNFIAAILLTLSCSSNHCKSTVCPENFTCEDGQCVCDEYHTGNNCEIELRETFYGTFTGIMNVYNEDFVLINSIEKSITVKDSTSDPTIMAIDDLVAFIDSRTLSFIFSIAKQDTSTNIQKEIRGYGGLVNGELDYNYTQTTQSVGPNLFPVIYKHYHFIGKR